jgi:hypothetical protein
MTTSYNFNRDGIILVQLENNIYIRIQKQTPTIATAYLYNIDTKQKLEDVLSDIAIYNISKGFYIQNFPKYNYYGIYLENDYLVYYKNKEVAIIQNT